MSNDLDRLRKAAEDQGFEVVPLKSGHWAVFTAHGAHVTGLPSTPSDRRGFANAVSALRRNGFIWPPPSRKELRSRKRKQSPEAE